MSSLTVGFPSGTGEASFSVAVNIVEHEDSPVHMKNITLQPDDTIRRYLLGKLSGPEMDRFEEALLRDDETFRGLVATEDELIDECASGALTEAERTEFLRYLSALPARKREMQVASALTELAAQPTGETTRLPSGSPSFPGMRVLSVAALVLVMIGASYSLHLITGLTTEPDTGMPDNPVLRASEDDGRAFVLRAGTLRSAGDRQEWVLTPGSPSIPFALDLPSRDYTSYRAGVYDADAVELFAADELVASVTDAEVLVSLVVPQDELAPGDYFIVLSGVLATGKLETLARYDFRLSDR